jgi:hypothetical protein
MAGPSFSLRGLLTFTALTAVACFAFKTGSPYWYIPLPFLISMGAALETHYFLCRRRVGSTILIDGFVGLVAFVAATAVAHVAFYESQRVGDSEYRWYHERTGMLHFVCGMGTAFLTAYVAQLVWPAKKS